MNQSDRRISCRPAGRPERPHPGGQASAGEPWVWKSRETAQPGAAYRDEARCAQEPGSPPTVAASRLTTGPFGVNNSYSASNRRLWSSASLSLAKQRWRAPALVGLPGHMGTRAGLTSGLPRFAARPSGRRLLSAQVTEIGLMRDIALRTIAVLRDAVQLRESRGRVLRRLFAKLGEVVLPMESISENYIAISITYEFAVLF